MPHIGTPKDEEWENKVYTTTYIQHKTVKLEITATKLVQLVLATVQTNRH